MKLSKFISGINAQNLELKSRLWHLVLKKSRTRASKPLLSRYHYSFNKFECENQMYKFFY